MLYLDNAATTKMNKEVFDAMEPYFMDYYGNTEGKFYDQALIANEAVDKARKQVASLFNCTFNDVIFTSGATEGNNTILKGIFDKSNFKGNMITTTIEHSATYQTCKYLEGKGVTVNYLKVNREGLIDINDLKNYIDKDTKLISIILVNNEIGSIQPIEEISNICFKNHIPFHIDATQAVGKMAIDLKKYKGISFITFSAHKIYGPKGVGCIVRTKNNKGNYYEFTPLIFGGEQEFGLRSGTLNVPGIVGCGKACEIIKRDFDKIHQNIINNTKKIADLIKKHFGEYVIFNNDLNKSIPGIINCRIKGINNELFLKSIVDIFGASTGSACSNLKPSRILKEIGLDDIEISESIRISVSPYITEKEIEILDKKLGE